MQQPLFQSTASLIMQHEPGVQALALEPSAAKTPRAKVEVDSVGETLAAAVRKKAGQNVGIVPIVGPITYKDGVLTKYYGFTSVKSIEARLNAMLADVEINTILLYVDSPGGSVQGIKDLAAAVYAAREIKPVVAVADGLMASAAYYVASAASEVWATTDTLVGSVGVYSYGESWAKWFEANGIEPYYIFAGENKVNGAPELPLSEEARSEAQSRVDGYYSEFVASVARGRGVNTSVVEADFGQGSVFRAQEALKRGMIDKVGGLSAALERLGAGSAKPAVGAEKVALSVSLAEAMLALG